MHPPSTKRRETARAILGSCLAVSLLLGGAARAQPAGGAATPVAPPRLSAAQILRKMEATNNDFADQRLEEQLTVVDVDGARKSYDFTLYQKGGVKRLIEFTSGELKGMSMLVEDRNSVYVYLPGFRKVRRVAASHMNQTLVGSDLSNDDMATVS